MAYSVPRRRYFFDSILAQPGFFSVANPTGFPVSLPINQQEEVVANPIVSPIHTQQAEEKNLTSILLTFSKKQQPKLRKTSKLSNVLIRLLELLALLAENGKFFVEALQNPKEELANTLGNAAAVLLFISSVLDIGKSVLRLPTLFSQQTFTKQQLSQETNQEKTALLQWELKKIDLEFIRHYGSIVLNLGKAAAAVSILVSSPPGWTLFAVMMIDVLWNVGWLYIKRNHAKKLEQLDPNFEQNELFKEYVRTRSWTKPVYDGGLDFVLKFACAGTIVGLQAIGLSAGVQAVTLIAGMIGLSTMAVMLGYHSKRLTCGTEDGTEAKVTETVETEETPTPNATDACTQFGIWEPPQPSTTLDSEHAASHLLYDLLL